MPNVHAIGCSYVEGSCAELSFFCFLLCHYDYIASTEGRSLNVKEIKILHSLQSLAKNHSWLYLKSTQMLWLCSSMACSHKLFFHGPIIKHYNVQNVLRYPNPITLEQHRCYRRSSLRASDPWNKNLISTSTAALGVDVFDIPLFYFTMGKNMFLLPLSIGSCCSLDPTKLCKQLLRNKVVSFIRLEIIHRCCS